MLQFGQLALSDQQMLLKFYVALEEVVVFVLEVDEDGFLLLHVALDDGQFFLHLAGLFLLMEEVGLEFVHFAVFVEECEMQTEALFFLLLQFCKQSLHLLDELPAINGRLVINRALYLLLNGDIFLDFLVHELHDPLLKFFYSCILQANLLLALD